jgi:hypothetical protein
MKDDNLIVLKGPMAGHIGSYVILEK